MKNKNNILKDKYTEIFKLKNILEKANIPFEFNIITNKYDHLYALGERYQICYPDAGPNIKCSVIEGKGTYGAEEDLLEIMGLLTQKEQMNDSVLGYLNAKEVFNRIKKDYDNDKYIQQRFRKKR